MKINPKKSQVIYTTAANNLITLRRQKKSVREERKKECKAIAYTNLGLDYIINASNVATSAASSASFLGMPVASMTAFVSANAYAGKLVADLSYFEKGCATIPFEEIQDMLDKRFNHVDESLKNLEVKIDRNFNAIKSGVTELKEELNKIRYLVKDSNIEALASKLMTVIEYFFLEKNGLKYLSHDEIIAKFNNSEGILSYLKSSRTPNSATSLHTLLNDIIHQKSTVPENPDDGVAFTALFLLSEGTDTYISMLDFLLGGYSYLANHYYEKKELDTYNKYFPLMTVTLKDFTNSLNGINGQKGLIDKVIQVFNTVKILDFVQKDSDMANFISKKIEYLNQIKSHLVTINSLPISKPTEQIKYDFSTSSIKTPFMKWQDRKQVHYAMQYESKGFYSQVGDWSLPYTIHEKACPTLDIGIAPEGMTRLIFRKFAGDKPELVAIVENSNQTEFRDIHRDFYNLASEPNEVIAKRDMSSLISDGSRSTAIFDKGRQAIHAAAETGNIRIILAVMEKGANINAQDMNGYAPIHIAAERGYENFIKDLIIHGAAVNATTHLNQTALHIAAAKGHVNTLQNLLQTPNIDINKSDISGFTALHQAVFFNKKAIVDSLSQDDRTNVNAKSETGLTPLHLAVLSKYKIIAQTLLNNNRINVNAEAKENLTALHFASIVGEIDITRQLLAHTQIDINTSSMEGWTALHLAIFSKKESVALILLDDTAIKVNEKGGKNGLTPLHLAASSGQNTILSKLLDKGATIETPDKNGYNALHFAIEAGKLDTVKLLVKRGADILVPTEQIKGETPLTLAQKGSHPDIADYIQSEITSLCPTCHTGYGKGTFEITSRRRRSIESEPLTKAFNTTHNATMASSVYKLVENSTSPLLIQAENQTISQTLITPIDVTHATTALLSLTLAGFYGFFVKKQNSEAKSKIVSNGSKDNVMAEKLIAAEKRFEESMRKIW